MGKHNHLQRKEENETKITNNNINEWHLSEWLRADNLHINTIAHTQYTRSRRTFMYYIFTFYIHCTIVLVWYAYNFPIIINISLYLCRNTYSLFQSLLLLLCVLMRELCMVTPHYIHIDVFAYGVHALESERTRERKKERDDGNFC